MKLLRRRDPEPEPVDETDETRRWEQLLASHRTWAPRSVVRARYHDEARQRQRARAAAKTHPVPRTSESLLLDTHASAPPQPRAETVPTPPAPFVRAVPSESSAVPAPKTSDEWAYEHFVAFEKLCGNAGRIAERLEEARAYEPEDPLPDYVW